jgi:hypothetical protein
LPSTEKAWLTSVDEPQITLLALVPELLPQITL